MFFLLAWRNILARPGTLLVAVLAISASAFSAAGGAALVSSLSTTMAGTARPDIAILLQRGADAEMASVISRDAVSKAGARVGASEVCPELVTAIVTRQVGSGAISNTLVRGVSDCSSAIRQGFRIREGRAPEGSAEALVGSRLRGRLQDLALGETIALPRGGRATVVGFFDDAGSSTESEVWVPYAPLAAAFRREGYYSSAMFRLPPSRQAEAKQTVEHDRDLGYRLMSDEEFRRMQGHMTLLLVISLAVFVTVFVVLASSAAAAATTMLSVSSRVREIGVLRALGFSAPRVFLSLTFELLLIGGLGGAFGTALAWPLRYAHLALLNTANFSELVLSFHLSARAAALGVMVGVAASLLGGAIPAAAFSRISPLKAARG